LRLCIVDDGEGFACDAAVQNEGLGLVSMEERVRLVNGDFRVESHPGGGTRVEATIPSSGDES
jgi:signal transduction histidine kinase